MKSVTIIILSLILIFLGPYIVLLGWNAARELWPELPAATYWQVFWIANALSLIFKGHTNYTRS